MTSRVFSSRVYHKSRDKLRSSHNGRRKSVWSFQIIRLPVKPAMTYFKSGMTNKKRAKIAVIGKKCYICG